ncbi:hypothetical protein DFR70_105259 [Nocardia tenerifensis]|uniref:Uncharacterized protein n=1 Tax=Nocardia tenerifensis TaxID=228006 RepID=A0A318K0Y8_9NOCA|nr:hypothetical protein [Nocardia tenerifensis]PXX64077.1 hypothetical protein DFR70_105259 [Nocardia tenerifensis]
MSTHDPGDERPGDRPDEASAAAGQPPGTSGAHEATPGDTAEFTTNDPAASGAETPAATPETSAVTPNSPAATTETAATQQVPPRRGSVQRQEAGVTQPRPPTVAEARARDKARKRAEEAQRAAAAAAEAKKRTRKRVMIGGVAIVGVAALVGGGYLVYRAITAPDQVTASCVKIENGQEVVVPDSYCGDGRPGFVNDGGIGPGLIILGGGPQYRYYYGGTPNIGKPPTGGTTVRPKSAEIKTKSGTTIQRGGLGSKSTGGGS